ncbi:MAG: hypothetical protein U1F52_21760 [Burkholderiales bacterium]
MSPPADMPDDRDVTGIKRTLGRSDPIASALPLPPDAHAREWVGAMGRFRTRVPKGVFRYRTHEDANRDWERWQVDTILSSGDAR